MKKTILVGLSMVLMVSGCKSKNDLPPEPPPQPVAPPPEPEPKPAAKLSELDKTLLWSHVETRMKVIRSEATLKMKKEPPLLEFAKTLIEAGASEVGYLLAPSGSTFGFMAAGDGEPFGMAVAGMVEAMLDKKMRKWFLTLAHYNDWRGVRFEICFGQPGWIRAGIRGISFTKVRVAMEEMKIPETEIARALVDAEKGGGTAQGMDIIADLRKGSSLIIPVAVEKIPDDIPDKKAAAGGNPVVERPIVWKDPIYVRRTGLQGLKLIDWQHAHGLKEKGAGQRLGKIHAFLETEAPTQIIWQSGHLGDTLVYLYTEKVADIIKPSH